MTESTVMKIICGNQGSINVDELVSLPCFGDSQDVREIILDREKFAWCSSGGQQKVVAKTEVRLCKAKDCQGCSSLHLCKNFLLGSCQLSQKWRRCRFSHDLKSAYNMKILREHELEDLDLKELCTLLLQNDNFLLPPICYDYNKGDEPCGWCQDGDGCTRLHICEKHLKGVCLCPRTHDFSDPQPLKTLEGRGVPIKLISSMKSIYMNKEVLGSCDRGNEGNRKVQRAFSISGVPAARAASSALNRRDTLRPKKSSEFAKDKTEICLYFINGPCMHGEKCFKAHEKLPYRWQVRQGQQWTALPDNEEIEKDYCDPGKTYSSRSQTVCFDTMTCGPNEVRRLSTASSVRHPTFVLTTKWVWYWEDEFGNWNLYASATGGHQAANISSAELEQKFLNDEKDVFEFTVGSQTYSLSFQDMIQTNKQYSTKKVVRRRPVFVSSADALTKKFSKTQSNFKAAPAHWDKTKIPETGFKRVSLHSSSAEYQEIEGLFCDTMRGFDIVQIERIQNKALWEVFEWQKDQMKKNNSGQNVTERKLFHGTDSKHVGAICLDNFDWRICGTHGTALGKGSYFAQDAKYSHSYTSQSDVKSMFISRVLVGDFTQGSSKYLRPPSRDGGDPRFYDSCVDDIRNPSIFVVFEKHQIYPEYLLQYKEKTSKHLRWSYGVASVPARVPPLSRPYPSLGTPVAQPSAPVPPPISQYRPPSTPVSTPIKPVPSPSAPVSTSANPVPSTSAPVYIPTSHYRSPSAPVSTLINPVPSPSAPVSTLVNPVPSPSAPVSTSANPVPSTSAPVYIPTSHYRSPSAPVSTLINPVPSPSAPVSTLVNPVPSPSAPVSTPLKPVPSPSAPDSTLTNPVPSRVPVSRLIKQFNERLNEK
ncbi:protein mono-ADP-ribosyltransferase PARP12-like [Centroberyx affinis]|uniref:protein mono-ADP-ribosyltransferase PARP12-like n=1 Tax=Centroberyx affinis TaxID=166261 RepID=UPI003A5BB849